MNLPNALSLLRIIMTAVFVCFSSSEAFFAQITALILFIVAMLTDWLDGYLARKLNLITALGKLLDPLADKIMVAAAFVLFTARGICPAWVTIVILFREFTVTGLRLIAVEQGLVVAADQFGKWKTTFQMLYCLAVLIALVVPAIAVNALWIQALLWVAVILTVLSGGLIAVRTGKQLRLS